MNINSDGFSRQQFFKGSMLDNDQTYLSYPMELKYEGRISNRANLNNELTGDVEIANHDVSFLTNTITHVRGFRTTEKWTNRINTKTDTVGSKSMLLENADSGAFLNGSQFDGASLDDTAGWVSFMFDGSDGVVNTSDSYLTRRYFLCTIWGQEPSENVGADKAISLFVRRFQDSDGTSSGVKYYMYLDDWRGSASVSGKYWLGLDFQVYGSDGDTQDSISQRYIFKVD